MPTDPLMSIIVLKDFQGSHLGTGQIPFSENPPEFVILNGEVPMLFANVCS